MKKKKSVNELEIVPVLYYIYQYQKDYIDKKAKEVRKSEHNFSNRKYVGQSGYLRELISKDILSK